MAQDPQSSRRTVSVIKAFLTKGVRIAMLVASERRLRKLHDARVTDENDRALFNVEGFLFPAELRTQWPSDALQLSRTAGRYARGYIIADGKSVGLVCLAVHYKDGGMLVTHDVKAHAPLPSIKTRTGSVPAGR